MDAVKLIFDVSAYVALLNADVIITEKMALAGHTTPRVPATAKILTWWSSATMNDH